MNVFSTTDELRSWFEANHASATEAFIGYFRKGVPKTSVTYSQAVDEALCFGWIDGITFRVDEEVTANRFTPRRSTSNWSAVNIAKVAKLRAAGRMQPAGLRAFEQRDRRKDATYSYERPPVVLPTEWLAALEANPAARSFWESETKTFRSQASTWVMSAKRAETRERRFTALRDAAEEGHRPRPWLVSANERNEAGS